MVMINNKISVIKLGNKLPIEIITRLHGGSAIAYVTRTDKKFFDGKGRYTYDFRLSWQYIDDKHIDGLENQIKEQFYKPNSVSYINVTSRLIEFDHFWEERNKIHKEMLKMLRYKGVIRDQMDEENKSLLDLM